MSLSVPIAYITVAKIILIKHSAKGPAWYLWVGTGRVLKIWTVIEHGISKT